MSELLDQLKFIKENLQRLETVETIGYKISEKETFLMAPECKIDYNTLISNFIYTLTLTVLPATMENKNVLGKMLIEKFIYIDLPQKILLDPSSNYFSFSEYVVNNFLLTISKKLALPERKKKEKIKELKGDIQASGIKFQGAILNIINSLTKNIRTITGLPESDKTEYEIIREQSNKSNIKILIDPDTGYRVYVKENNILAREDEKSENQIEIVDGEIKSDLIIKDDLSHKQEILLLDRLGVFDIPIIYELTGTKKGLLFSKLLNAHKKNIKDYISNRFSKAPNGKYALYTPDNIKKVNEILESVGLEKIVVTTRPTTQSK